MWPGGLWRWTPDWAIGDAALYQWFELKSRKAPKPYSNTDGLNFQRYAYLLVTVTGDSYFLLVRKYIFLVGSVLITYDLSWVYFIIFSHASHWLLSYISKENLHTVSYHQTVAMSPTLLYHINNHLNMYTRVISINKKLRKFIILPF